MSSVVRSVLGAALLLTGASAAMAQSANAPLYQSAQPVAPAATAPAANAPLAYQSAQPSTAVVAAAPVAPQPRKQVAPSDNTDQYGGHDPKSLQGTRDFWQNQLTY